MPLNADKTALWKADIAASIDQYNRWFIHFAPSAYRETRSKTVDKVRQDLDTTEHLTQLTPDILMAFPGVLPTLRMSTAPPLARDRLIGLAHVTPNLVDTLERGNLPPRMQTALLAQSLSRICEVIVQLVDQDLFPWLSAGRAPDETEQRRAAIVVADRLCGSIADPIIRNAQERRQLALIENFLRTHGYTPAPGNRYGLLTDMPFGTFGFRRNVPVGKI